MSAENASKFRVANPAKELRFFGSLADFVVECTFICLRRRAYAAICKFCNIVFLFVFSNNEFNFIYLSCRDCATFRRWIRNTNIPWWSWETSKQNTYTSTFVLYLSNQFNSCSYSSDMLGIKGMHCLGEMHLSWLNFYMQSKRLVSKLKTFWSWESENTLGELKIN